MADQHNKQTRHVFNNFAYNSIVFKVGTTTLIYDNGKLNIPRMEKLVRVLADLKNRGKNVILVTSGAIGVGAGKLGIKNKKDIKIKQALAAVGQGILMQFYEKLFAEYDTSVAQILLTREDIEKAPRRQNALNTIRTLFDFDIIPIINENDTVAVDEIVFGDNDTLSAVVARLIGADILILLSDIDGLYTGIPSKNGSVKIPIVDCITPEIEALAGESGSEFGTGGMKSKIFAAKIATCAGIAMAIIDGTNPELIYGVLEGKNPGTFFMPQKNCNVIGLS
ncbi:MAG: glutamate 5-kinase [Tepidanaerobacteraceae bacterium]|jgi:glutamate 5-kinase|nr:glutamate 5-kinase [Tepidanaerobacteraceae bacterium]